MGTDYKPPFIRWFENDFWADRDVILLTWLQRHLYRTLLLSAFFCDTRPFLPDDDSRLWKLADAESLEMWIENRDAILAKFTVLEGEDGQKLLRNKRLDEEWAHLLKSLQRQRNAGLASAANRASRGSTSVDGGSTEVNLPEYRVQSTESEYRVQSTESKKHSPSSKLDGMMTPDGFDEFWQAYPEDYRDANEITQAIEAWKKVAPDADLRAKIMAQVNADKETGLLGSPAVAIIEFAPLVKR